MDQEKKIQLTKGLLEQWVQRRNPRDGNYPKELDQLCFLHDVPILDTSPSTLPWLPSLLSYFLLLVLVIVIAGLFFWLASHFFFSF